MIYIIRHGQTEQNRRGLIQGQGDYPLNDTGEQQARDARDRFKRMGIKFARVYSSPLARALRTAEIVTWDGDIIQDGRLIEMDYGPYEGVDMRNMPDEMKVFFSDFRNNPAPDGMEQLPDLVRRLGYFLEDLKPALDILLKDDPSANILLSTHAIAMKAALEYLTPGSDGSYWNKFVGNCEIYTFEYKDGEYTVPQKLVDGSLEQV